MEANDLIDGYRRAQKASGWKESTQRYGINLLSNTMKLQRSIKDDTYKQGKGSEFTICEHGHTRRIKSLQVDDQIVQHALVNSVLIPKLSPHLIHDNGASLTGKGISFTRRRLVQHLRRYYRENGTEGYVLLIDFRKFFDNIDHAKLSSEIYNVIRDDKLKKFVDKLLESYRVSIGGTDWSMDTVFNSLEYAGGDDSEMLTKGLGIGSPVSQISGIFFPHAIDDYCKTVKQCKFYDVYMDDRIVIHRSKEFLQELLTDIESIATSLGLYINHRKTQIVKLSHGFTFLKTKYYITGTGKVIRRIPRDIVTVERRKLKKLAMLVIEGAMTEAQFSSQYRSWRGDKRKYNAYRTLQSLDAEYRRLITWIKTKRNTSR